MANEQLAHELEPQSYTVGVIDESAGVWPQAIERIKKWAAKSASERGGDD